MGHEGVSEVCQGTSRRGRRREGMSGPRGATEQDHEIPRRRVTAGDI
jgi:hypothetical protein